MKNTEKRTAKSIVAEQVTALVIKAIEEDKVIPWVKPWKGGKLITQLRAVNYITRRPYSFANQLMLDGDGEWMTFKQCEGLGGTIRKGAKSRIVCQYFKSKPKPTEKTDEDGNTTIVMTNGYWASTFVRVFALNDCLDKDGNPFPSKFAKVEEEPKPIVSVEPIAVAEDAISKYVAMSGITFINDIESSSAYYSPKEDKVVVPNLSQYAYSNEYYSTTFHELTHSTLTEKRCNRKQSEDGVRACFGNAPYAKEELVAELGSCLCLAQLGINTETTERNSAAYLQNWLGVLKKDPQFLFDAMQFAEKASKFILNEGATETVAV